MHQSPDPPNTFNILFCVFLIDFLKNDILNFYLLELFRAIYERQVAKLSLSRRIVDEKNIDRLTVDSNRALMIFKDQTFLPPPDPLGEDAGDSIIQEISKEDICGNYLSSTPIKMESLMVESKQQLTASEKRQGADLKKKLFGDFF